MEIEGRDGSRTHFKIGSVFEFGRGSGFKTDDRTVSRRHVSFRVNPVDKSMAEFKVIGKNPVWVHSCKSRQVSTFRASESGEMEIGDMFCVSAKNPTWFALKKAEFEAETENTVKSESDFKTQSDESLENRFQIEDIVSPLEPESIDISNIDPIKEFGFLVIGKEFDSYPKKMIRDMKNWNWFIEDPRVNNEEDEDDEEIEEKKKRRRKRKNRREENEEDEEWTGESEEEKKQLTNTRKVQRPNKYVTRSRDRHESGKDVSTVSNVDVKRSDDEVEEEEEDDDDDETLGGFIVDDDDNVEEEPEEIDDVDEEEEENDEEFHD